MKKLVVLCREGLETFILPVIERLKGQYEIKLVVANSLFDVSMAVKEADIVWFEWANEILWRLSNYPKIAEMLKDKHVIVRYHSYELFLGLASKINWTLVDDVIFVADHVKQAAEGDLFPENRIHVIPNGIDCEKFAPTGQKEKNNQIALLGHINAKKGPMLLAHAFHALQVESGRYYHLHIAGDVQDGRYDHYFAHIFNELGIAEDISYHPYVEDVPAFLQDKSYILCTSPWESQNLSVMEGMACGCQPVVHNFPGAKDIYPEEFVWTTINEFSQMITEDDDWNPGSYRMWVIRNFKLEWIVDKINEVLKSGRKIPQPSADPLPVTGNPVERREVGDLGADSRG